MVEQPKPKDLWGTWWPVFLSPFPDDPFPWLFLGSSSSWLQSVRGRFYSLQCGAVTCFPDHLFFMVTCSFHSSCLLPIFLSYKPHHFPGEKSHCYTFASDPGAFRPSRVWPSLTVSTWLPLILSPVDRWTTASPELLAACWFSYPLKNEADIR